MTLTPPPSRGQIRRSLRPPFPAESSAPGLPRLATPVSASDSALATDRTSVELALEVDVSHADAMAAFADRLATRYGGIDLWANDAGSLSRWAEFPS